MRARRPARFGSVALGACALVASVAAAEAGHLLLDAIGADSAHEVFHAAYPAVALAIFGVVVWRHVRRFGPVTFTWRLRPAPVAGGSTSSPQRGESGTSAPARSWRSRNAWPPQRPPG